MPFAGSAIAQNAGRLDNFESWRPGTQETKWLLLAGATDPPCETSTRRTRNVERTGSFLRGVINDLGMMEASDVVKTYNVVRDYYLEKEDARTKIKKFFSICKRQKCQPVLYYMVHGQVGTGNWCFSDGTLGIQVERSPVKDNDHDAIHP